MEFFIDEKVVSEKDFNEKIFGQLFINVSQRIQDFIEYDEYKEYLKLSPMKQTLLEIGMAKKEALKYNNQKEFEINGFRFKKEE